MKPGYQVGSSSFIVEFIAAHQIDYEDDQEEEEEEEEEENNWHHMMVQLVNAFEMWPKDMARIEKEAVKDFNVKRVQITDTFTRIKNKKVRVHLQDDMTPDILVLIFEVKKKVKLLTLAARIISDCVSKKEDFGQLEVPKELLADLNEAYDDIWKCKNCKFKLEDTYYVQCPSNFTHKFCFTCTRNYIIIHQVSSSKVFCPSGEKCLFDGVPWSFFEMEIKTILGDHPDKEKEKEEESRPGSTGRSPEFRFGIMKWVTQKVLVTAQRQIPISHFLILPGLGIGLGLGLGLVNKMLRR